jgi:hypothetical protein
MRAAPDAPAGARLGRLGAASDLLLTGILSVLLLALTNQSSDAIPRPLALLPLYAAPGLVGALGVVGRRRSLLAAAGVVLAPGCLLSFAGVTLIFVLPLALFLAAAATMGPPDPKPSRLTELVEISVVSGLVLTAGVSLFALASAGCNASGSICGSGFVTARGVAIEVVLLIAAVGFAAFRVLPARRSA